MARKKVEHTFTKSQLVGSQRFIAYRDILRSQLKAGETYTIAQCEKIIENFLHPGSKDEQEENMKEGE